MYLAPSCRPRGPGWRAVRAAGGAGHPAQRPHDVAGDDAPRFMVANPFAFAAADSAPPWRSAPALRSEMKDVVGRDFQVVEQTADERRPHAVRLSQGRHPEPRARHHAGQEHPGALPGGARRWPRAQGNRYTVTARLTGVNDDAGNVVTLAQNAGREPAGVRQAARRGARADGRVAARRQGLRRSAHQQAGQGGRGRPTRRSRSLPDHGLAHYCLALLAQDKKAPRGEVVKHLQAAAKGDPLSLPVWTALATQYQQANDTANTLVAFKQMLRVAPTNQKLREELFKYFLQSGHPGDRARGGRRGPQDRSVQRRPVRPEEQRLPLPQQLQVRGGRAGDDVRHRLHQGGHALLHQDLGRRRRG